MIGIINVCAYLSIKKLEIKTVYFCNNFYFFLSLHADASQSGCQIYEEHVETKAYVMDPKFSTPTSLPLYFSLGSKVLQQKEESSDNCWKVSLFDVLLTKYSTLRNPSEENMH